MIARNENLIVKFGDRVRFAADLTQPRWAWEMYRGRIVAVNPSNRSALVQWEHSVSWHWWREIEVIVGPEPDYGVFQRVYPI